MAQYLMALLGHRGPMDPTFGTGMGGIEEGRMGDYVFNQEGESSFFFDYPCIIKIPFEQHWII